MKVLLWKEFREKRVWGLLWALSIVLVLGLTVNFCGEGDIFTGWLLLPILLSLVVGAGAYSTEFKDNRVDFLYSQPIGWTKLLLAKAFFGLAVTLGSTVLAAIVFRVVCPDYYAGFATPAALAESIRPIVWWLWTLYLSGLFFSVVLPGVTGSLIVLIVCLLPLIALEWVGDNYVPASARDMFRVGTEYIILVGSAIGALMLLRFGLSLPLKSRVIRYGLVMLLASVAVPALFLIVPKDAFVSAICKKGYDWSNVSPRGNYALVHYTWRWSPNTGLVSSSFNLREGHYLVRLSDGKATPVGLDLPRDAQYFWADRNTVYFYSPSAPGIQILRMTSSDKLITQTVKIAGNQPRVLPSPDGRLALIASQDTSSKTALEFVNIKAARKMDEVLREVNAYWWNANRQVGYQDGDGKRHMLNLQL
ncbi:MAG: hypothetical protein M1133_14335 [Armatimonadetes bacterium]|nr:hypothetical protein [Armatimonadota bacterium]